MPIDTKKLPLADLEWLVGQRSVIQTRCLQLLQVEDSVPADDEQRQAIYKLLVGAAFSLWRAVFLGVGPTPTPKETFATAGSFLRTLVVDNAIGFPQDKAANHWMFGYYINNTHFRLVEANAKLASLEAADPRNPGTLQKPDADDSRKALDAMLVSYTEAFERFSKHLKQRTA